MGSNTIKYEPSKSLFIYLTIFTFVIALYLVLTNKPTLAVGFISIAIACISAFLGIESIKLGEKSRQIAEDSDKKMNINANVNFLRVCSDIEDVRVSFNIHFYDEELLTWKTENLVKIATEMIKEYETGYIKKEHQDKLVRYVRTSLDCLFQKKSWDKVKSGRQGNVLRTWDMIFENKYYYKPKTKKKIREIFIGEMGMRTRENEGRFIKRLQNEK